VGFDLDLCADETIRAYGKENRLYLPLAWDGVRWNIEISYYEGKTFWFMEEYRIRTRKGTERLINLISLSYSTMTLLPYSGDTFSEYRSVSDLQKRQQLLKEKTKGLEFINTLLSDRLALHRGNILDLPVKNTRMDMGS